MSSRRPVRISSSTPPSKMAPQMTVRFTPQDAFPEIQRTCDVVKHHVKFYGRIARLRRSNEKKDYFDVEFMSREDAEDAINKCIIEDMTSAWAPENISDNPEKGPAEVSYKPPRRDLDDHNTLSSVPLPRNNAFENRWCVPEQKKAGRGKKRQPSPEPVYCCRPKRIQINAANPKAPSATRYWPAFPEYPPPRQ